MSICAENITGRQAKVIVNNVSLGGCREAKRSDCWDPTAAANPRCCAFWRACAARMQVASPSTAGYRPDGEKQLARRVAFVEQHGMTEANMRVRDVVRPGRIPHHSPFSNWSTQDDEAIAAALQRVAMLEKSEQGWLSLSGGERQRVHIARALAQSPSESAG